MLGTVTVLRRYPVKSMLGEDLDASDVSHHGLARDRRLAVVSRRTGKVASAKYPRLWRDLLTLSAEALDEGARITLPGGKSVCSTDADVDEILSALLNEPVTLTATPPPGASLDRAVPEAVLRDGIKAQVPAEIIEIGAGAPPGTFVDFAPLHLLTTATLDRIAELSPYRRAHLKRYRPNVVIRTEAGGFPENDWPGRDLLVGDDLVLRVIARTPRCAVPTLAHGDLPRDTEALRVLARHNRVTPLAGLGPEPCAGVYAEVLRPGLIRVGDAVRRPSVSGRRLGLQRGSRGPADRPRAAQRGPPPRQDALDLGFQREAQERPDRHDQPEHVDILEGGRDGHGANQVGGDQDLQPEQQGPAEGLAQDQVSLGRPPGLPHGHRREHEGPDHADYQDGGTQCFETLGHVIHHLVERPSRRLGCGRSEDHVHLPTVVRCRRENLTPPG